MSSDPSLAAWDAAEESVLVAEGPDKGARGVEVGGNDVDAVIWRRIAGSRAGESGDLKAVAFLQKGGNGSGAHIHMRLCCSIITGCLMVRV